jgi:hypothetical protein
LFRLFVVSSFCHEKRRSKKSTETRKELKGGKHLYHNGLFVTRGVEELRLQELFATRGVEELRLQELCL